MIARRRMFDRRPILTQFADKCSAREYIAQRLGPRVLPRRLHVATDPQAIPWDELPQRYVVKATHGSGWVRIVDGPADSADLTRLCSEWLSKSYYRMMREWPYKNIQPRIIIEEFIDDGNGQAPTDYKFFVFHGKPRFVQVDASRFTGHTRSLYDLSWKRLGFTMGYPPIPHDVPRPAHLTEMAEAAGRLADDVDFLRIDFYDTKRQFYVGEITTTPGAGLDRFSPPIANAQVGAFWLNRTASSKAMPPRAPD